MSTDSPFGTMKQSETATSRWYWGLLAIALLTHGPVDNSCGPAPI